MWRGERVSLFPWVAGRTLARAELTPAHAAAVGAALARLHLASAGYADHRPGRYEPDEIATRLARVAALRAARAGRRGRGADARAHAAARPNARRSVPMGIIHGDLFVDNVMFDDGGALTALIDFEQASWGRLAYDLAVTTLAFGFGRDDFRADIVRALIDGYAAAPRAHLATSGPRSAPSCASPPAGSRSRASPTSTSSATPAPRPARTSSATSTAWPASAPTSRPPTALATDRVSGARLRAEPSRGRNLQGSEGRGYLRTMLMYLRKVSLRSSSRST